MDPLRWQRVEALFADAMDREPALRKAFVRNAAGGDAELEREVLSLVDAADTDPTFLGTPLVDLAAEGAPETGTLGETRRVGRYRLVRLLGRGGMGEVHLAVQEGDDFERTVAVKLIRRGAESDELARRFRRERRILARLRHEHIAGLLDGGTDDDGTLYVVMEFVDGRRIDRYCDDRDLDVLARVRLMLDVCDAVQHAHRNLVLHRDLKPANILVTDEGVAKLLDFGIAKLLDRDTPDSTPLTRTDHRILTPEYAAPEQIRGEEATTASDVFALGVVLYELLAGVHPWASVAPHERLSAIEYGPPSRPSDVVTGSPADTSRRRRRLSGDLDTILLKALRAAPHRRYPTVDALADDLRRHLDGRPVSARPDTLGYRTSRFVRRNRIAVAAAAVVVTTVLGATSAVAVQRTRTAARVEAERDKLLATRDFLLEMFGAVGPDEMGGAEVSARALLDAQAERVVDYSDRPELQAEVQYVLADGYQRLGLVDDARPLAEASLATRQKTLGADHPDVARTRGLLGWIERERGDRTAAEAQLRAAVTAARSAEDPGAAGLAKSLNDLGVTLSDLGRHDEAVEVFRESLALRQDGAGTREGDARGVAITTNNLANAYWALGDRDEAIRLMDRSVEALERALGPEHGRVWLARANLLAFRTETLPAEERIAAWREHRDGARAQFGSNHRETARATQFLAAYLLQNPSGPGGGAPRVSEARALYDEALEIAETTFGPAHPRTADMLVGRSHAAMLLRDYPAAIADRERAVDIFRSAQGDDAPEIGLALREIARAWYGLGDGEAGDRVAREALEHFRRTRGPDHSLTLSQQVNVARRMTATGDAAGAVPLLREAAAGMETLDPPPVPVIAQTRIALALALLRSGDAAEAADLLDAMRPRLDSLPDVVRRQFEQVESEAAGTG